MEASLDVKFLEPTVGGLTGRQLALLRDLEIPEGDLCEHELFPRTQQGPAEFCQNDSESWSSYCSDHTPYEPDYDAIGKDLRYGFDE